MQHCNSCCLLKPHSTQAEQQQRSRNVSSSSSWLKKKYFEAVLCNCYQYRIPQCANEKTNECLLLRTDRESSCGGTLCWTKCWKWECECVAVSVLSAYIDKNHIRFKTCSGPSGSAQSGMQRMMGKQGPVKMWTCLCSLLVKKNKPIKPQDFSVRNVLSAVIDSRPLGDASLEETTGPLDESWKPVCVFFLLCSQRRHEDIILVVSHGR